MPPRSRAQEDAKSNDKSEESRPDGEEKLAQVGSEPGRLTSQFRLPLPEALTSGDTRKRLLWLGGLGAMAAVGLLEWPVAVAVGAGSVIAEQLARSGRTEQSEQAVRETGQA